MNISRHYFSGALAALVATGFVFLAPLSAHTSTDAHDTTSTAVVCEDENISKGVTWSVRIEVRAVRNDSGQEIRVIPVTTLRNGISNVSSTRIWATTRVTPLTPGFA